MNILVFYLIGPAIFFIIKLANLGLRFSDTNVYFYTAHQLLKGKLLYRDIFFTNLPLFPYVSSIYYWLIGGNIDFYYLTATIEVLTASFVIAYLVFQKTKNHFLAILLQSLYLFSFIILTTADHQTGVFLASLLSLLAYLFYQKNKLLISGVFLGLMVLTKAYYLPIAGAFVINEFFINKKRVLKILIGFIGSLGLILAPFLLLARPEFVNDVLSYSLGRPAGLAKANILLFFIKNDPALFLLFLFSLINLKKNRLLFFISLFSLIFVFLYKDVYYLYLNLVVPFLILAAEEAFYYVNKRKQAGKLIIIIILALIGGLLVKNLVLYFNDFANLQKINDLGLVTTAIEKEKPRFLYGAMEVTAALAYLIDTPLLGGIIDTNENLFNKKVLHAERLTKKIFENKTIVIGKGVYYPRQNINEPLVDIIFDKEKILKNCRQIYNLPIKTEGIINRLNFYRCY